MSLMKFSTEHGNEINDSDFIFEISKLYHFLGQEDKFREYLEKAIAKGTWL